MADVKQMKKIVPFVTCEISFSQYVCNLVFGVNVPDLNLGIQVDSVKQPIKSNSVSPGNMSHCRTPSFDDHFNRGFLIRKNVQHRAKSGKLRVRRGHSQHRPDQNCRAGLELWVFLFDMVSRDEFPRTWSLVLLSWFEEECNISLSKSHRSRAGIPSMRKPASREIISASVEQCETEVCFLHIQLIGTNVWLPNMHKSPPDVDFESSRSPAKIRVLKQS